MKPSDCIFCKIAAGEIPARLVFQDDEIVAFEDIKPQAPVHIVIIPRAHRATLNDLTDDDGALAGKLLLAARSIARERKVDRQGYRIVINCGSDGGQAVNHVHVHLLAGRALHWPPG